MECSWKLGSIQASLGSFLDKDPTNISYTMSANLSLDREDSIVWFLFETCVSVMSTDPELAQVS